ncbi:MAG: glycosyltransferase family 2 protein [Candidatus Woesearchaeota archaeon]
MKTLSIVVPCYNEEDSLPQLFSQMTEVSKQLLKDYRLDVVFVDDGSRDNTFAMLSGFKKKFKSSGVSVTICRHGKNRNLGAALKTAFKVVKGDLIVTADADCTYSLLDIPKLLALLDENTDIVSASPYHPEGKSAMMHAYRLFLSKAISKIYRVLTGSRIYTFTALFRVYRKKVIDDIHPKSDNFLAVTELLVYSLRKGYKVKEFPADLTARKYGKSKMKLLSTIMSHVSLIMRLIFRL